MNEVSLVEQPIADRVAGLDWARIERELDTRGFALTGPLLTVVERAGLTQDYDGEGLYRGHIKMARHGFGRGEYKYYRYPLPALVADLRSALYSRLVPTANRWAEALKSDARYPAMLDAFH